MHIYIYLFTILPRNLCIYRVMLFCMIIDVLFLSTSLSVYSCWIPPDGVAPCQCEVRTDLPSKIYFGENFISSLPWSLFSKRKPETLPAPLKNSMKWTRRTGISLATLPPVPAIVPRCPRKFMFDEVGFDTHKTGVIKLTVLGGLKHSNVW